MERQFEDKIKDIRLRLLKKKVSMARQMIHLNVNEDQLISVLKTRDKRHLDSIYPVKESDAHGPGVHRDTMDLPNTHSMGSSMSNYDLIQTIALQTIQFQQIMLQNMIQPSNGMQNHYSSSYHSTTDEKDRFKDKTTISIQTEETDDAFLERSKKREAEKEARKKELVSKKNNQRGLGESNPDDKDKIATIDDKMEQENNASFSDLEINEKEEHMKRVRVVLQVVWAVEIMRKLAKEAKICAKQVKETLDAGKKVVFINCRKQLLDAVRLNIKLSQEKIDLFPKKMTLKLFSSSKPNAQVVSILESFIKCIQEVNYKSLTLSMDDKVAIDGAIHLILFSGKLRKANFWDVELQVVPKVKEGKWYDKLTLIQAETLVTFNIIVKGLLRILVFPIEASILPKSIKNDLLFKNLKVFAFIIFRMVRGSLIKAKGDPLGDIPHEFLKWLNKDTTSNVWTDLNFKSLFKLYEPQIAKGENAIKEWSEKAYKDFYSSYKKLQEEKKAALAREEAEKARKEQERLRKEAESKLPVALPTDAGAINFTPTTLSGAPQELNLFPTSPQDLQPAVAPQVVPIGPSTGPLPTILEGPATQETEEMDSTLPSNPISTSTNAAPVQAADPTSIPTAQTEKITNPAPITEPQTAPSNPEPIQDTPKPADPNTINSPSSAAPATPTNVPAVDNSAPVTQEKESISTAQPSNPNPTTPAPALVAPLTTSPTIDPVTPAPPKPPQESVPQETAPVANTNNATTNNFPTQESIKPNESIKKEDKPSN